MDSVKKSVRCHPIINWDINIANFKDFWFSGQIARDCEDKESWNGCYPSFIIRSQSRKIEEKPWPDVLPLFTTFCDLPVSRNHFWNAKKRQFGEAQIEGLNYVYINSIYYYAKWFFRTLRSAYGRRAAKWATFRTFLARLPIWISSSVGLRVGCGVSPAETSKAAMRKLGVGWRRGYRRFRELQSLSWRNTTNSADERP